MCPFACDSLSLTRPLTSQGSPGVVQPRDPAVTVQHGMLVLCQALGPGVLSQRDDVRLALPGWLSDFHRQWQRNGESMTCYFPGKMKRVDLHQHGKQK